MHTSESSLSWRGSSDAQYMRHPSSAQAAQPPPLRASRLPCVSGSENANHTKEGEGNIMVGYVEEQSRGTGRMVIDATKMLF